MSYRTLANNLSQIQDQTPGMPLISDDNMRLILGSSVRDVVEKLQDPELSRAQKEEAMGSLERAILIIARLGFREVATRAAANYGFWEAEYHSKINTN